MSTCVTLPALPPFVKISEVLISHGKADGSRGNDFAVKGRFQGKLV